MAACKRYRQENNKLCTCENAGERNFAILFVHNYSWNKQIHKSEVFGAGAPCTFEGKEFIAPANTNEFLSKVFGDDYMLEPPEDKRKHPHSYISVSFDI